MPRLFVIDNGLKKNYSHHILRRLFCNKAKEKTIIAQKKWNSVVGLEVHAQISSNSKLFSGASTQFGSSVNSCVSFFDCATPGTLPVLNRRCVEAGVLTALALKCEINEISLFDRKHYFYADLPAGYQITQQRQPLAKNGELKFHVFAPEIHKEPYYKSSKLKQLQLEQDSGKTLHDESGRNLIDLNRAGIPLMELVFEPDLSDGEEAAALVKELILILERLNTCSCRMDEGALRIDANVSINKPNQPLGVRTEIKNIGSVRALASAVNYEIKRQINMSEEGKEVFNETRGWDPISNTTVSMRTKENKHDYRFMPEPNLLPLHIHVNESAENVHNLVDVTALVKQIPEMPQETRDRLQSTYNIPKALMIVMVNEPILLRLFMYLVNSNKNRSPLLISKIVTYQLLSFLYKNDMPLEFVEKIRDPLAELIDLRQEEKITLSVLEKALLLLLKDPQLSIKTTVEKNNWIQISDEDELTRICQNILDENPKSVKEYKRGKKKVFKFFMRMVAEKTNDRANMRKVVVIIQKMLE